MFKKIFIPIFIITLVSLPLSFYISLILSFIFVFLHINHPFINEGYYMWTIYSALVGSCLTYYFLTKKYDNLKQENETLKNNRDIPEIIKIEEEKWKLQKQKEEIKVAEQIKNSQLNLKLSLKTLRSITSGLKHDSLTLKISGTNIMISDDLTSYTITPSTTTRQPSYGTHHTLHAFETYIMKRVDKREFIAALRTVSTPFAEIVFNTNSPEVVIRQPRGGTQIYLNARN